jgi:diguanylate cyclase (GGDEF)-like protein/PAS domain S-box-containing protein
LRPAATSTPTFATWRTLQTLAQVAAIRPYSDDKLRLFSINLSFSRRMSEDGKASARRFSFGMSLLHAHRGAAVAFVTVLVIAVFSAVTALYLVEKRRNVEKRVELLTSSFVKIIDEQISASIDKIDLAIQALADELQDQIASRARIDLKAVDASMVRSTRRIPELNGLRVTDATGLVVAATGMDRNARVSFGDRDFFKRQKEGAHDQLIVSEPLQGRVSDGWVIVLSRKYANPDGSFAGVIAAPIKVSHFTKILSLLDLGPGGIALIRNRELALITRYPEIPGPAGAVGNKGASREFRDMVASGAPYGTFRSMATADGIARTSSYRVMARAPFVVLTGMSPDYYLLDWRSDVRNGIALDAGFALMLSLSGLLLWYLWRQQAREGALAKSVLDNAAEGIAVGRADGRIISVNRAFTEITGYSAEQAFGQLFGALHADQDAETFLHGVREEIAAKGRWQGEVWKRRKSGETFLALETISPVRNETGDIASYVVVFTDTTELHRKDERIRHLAYHDALTGLGNRVLLQQRAEEAFDRVRADAISFAILLIDLDRFKQVNDLLGHRTGDEMLRHVAERLRQCAGGDCTIARVGGDEFVILVAGSENANENARTLAVKVLQLVAAPYELNGTLVSAGASIGIAVAPRHGGNFDELFGHADLALYRAKSEGRNHFRFFDPDMGKAALERGKLELEMRAALENDQFELHYQPCVDISDGNIVGCEALVRWRHPVRGLISPAEFIPIAEEIGLIGPLGDWVLAHGCEQAARWPRPLKLAVNLSAAQFIGAGLYDTVQKALATSRLAPERLELEITESLLIDDYEGSLAILLRLREQGIGIALDDFGTGYSSLTYLRQFPFDRIKIDRGFVAEITTRSDCAAIVSAVAGLGRSLGIRITAEGIETHDQLVMVRAAGCTEAQGFLFGRPVPASELARILATNGSQHMNELCRTRQLRAGRPAKVHAG